MLDCSEPDIMGILKEMAYEMQNQSAHNLSDDTDVQDFMALLCQNIDSRNILTPAELSEYENMVEAGEVLHGKEFEDAFSELFPDGLQQIEEEDNCFITEEIEMADFHNSTVTQLQRTLIDEIQHVSSGLHQLEEQEQGAYYSLLAEGQHCVKLHTRVYSAQEELLKQLQCLAELLAEFKNVKSVPKLISQLPLETYRKRCQFDRYVKVMMKQFLEWDESSVGEDEDDHLEDLEQSFIEMKMEYVYMLACHQGKEAVIGKLKDIMNDIQASKFTVSFSEISSQSLLLDEEVNEGKRQVSHMLENEVLPTVEQAVKMDVLQIMKYKNEHKIFKLKRIFKQNDSLARCLERGLTNSELLLLLLVCERQKLTDMADLYEQCHQEITEEYTDFTSRMKVMQELRENNCSSSLVMENPLVQCLVRLLCDEHSVNSATVIHDLMINVKNLNKDIRNQEEKLFDSLFNKQKSVLLQNENAIKTAEKYLYAGLAKKPVLLRMEISASCNDIERLLESFQDVLKQIKDDYKRKQVAFSEKPFLQEQRLLWIHFLMYPKKLVALVRQLQELTETKINHNKLKYHMKKRRETRFFPQGMQK
ncbi:putative leucine-rich repeat-containing protein DDB_G0290503 isoform X2 [Zootermopsis nevadensis]|nr:putative leucine-rich repeat-containing protein DDB_G0290503 isoform X2 [Zootermopsis nevadensis]XP_021923116.1 putative leucine-rich repeat-containing protein DDB_G0290503 isoform X2 [Zootermopsis nevadensis]XP_021923117.1 putative leucine-rich repeat-containing protein DDB_G0290503 isoform X2 [Zootermopsis nevadensis]XP_021923118.1 putative leucine-rich repeat-containing protein DDB_G0290503 isoform X2 [Zootermopsis nevadensis]XP_021923119.1 putative leucine-rich repeat-containing protein 